MKHSRHNQDYHYAHNIILCLLTLGRLSSSCFIIWQFGRYRHFVKPSERDIHPLSRERDYSSDDLGPYPDHCRKLSYVGKTMKISICSLFVPKSKISALQFLSVRHVVPIWQSLTPGFTIVRHQWHMQNNH